MKLANVFLITALMGVVATMGCSETSGGTGGTGGSTTDACFGPLCQAAPEPKAACELFIGECDTTVEIDPTLEECEAWGNEIFCEEGAGGTGGGGGTGGAGGGGGTGGAGGELCNILGCEQDTDLKAKCEAAVAWCAAYCANDPECQEDECAGLDLLICNVAE